MDPPTTTCEPSPAAAAARTVSRPRFGPADEMMGTTDFRGPSGRPARVRGHAIRDGAAETKAEDRAAVPRDWVSLLARRSGERNIGAHHPTATPQATPWLTVYQRQGSGGFVRRASATQPVTVWHPRHQIHCREAVNAIQDAKGLPGSANGAELGDDTDPARNMSGSHRGNHITYLVHGDVAIHQVQVRPPADLPSLNVGLGHAWDPRLASTMAACSCQRGNGSSGSRSKCTRRPLRQRTGGVIPSGDLRCGNRVPRLRDQPFAPPHHRAGQLQHRASVCTAPRPYPAAGAAAQLHQQLHHRRTVATPDLH